MSSGQLYITNNFLSHFSKEYKNCSSCEFWLYHFLREIDEIKEPLKKKKKKKKRKEKTNYSKQNKTKQAKQKATIRRPLQRCNRCILQSQPTEPANVQKKYKNRHDWIGKVSHWELCKWPKFDRTDKWYMHKLESSKFLWDFNINGSSNPRQTYRLSFK